MQRERESQIVYIMARGDKPRRTVNLWRTVSHLVLHQKDSKTLGKIQLKVAQDRGEVPLKGAQDRGEVPLKGAQDRGEVPLKGA